MNLAQNNEKLTFSKISEYYYKREYMTKIVLIGTGAVGTSFVYSLINQNIQSNYVLIDVFNDVAEGHARDIMDGIYALNQSGSKIQVGNYSDCSNADIIVITAGRPQKTSSETRLEMINDNVKIISEIGKNVKKSGFSGITIIASNPCDILATVYQKITKFPEKKVMSSGTLLDTVRMKRFLGQKLHVHPGSIDGYVLGEHGDKSVPAFSLMQIGGISLSHFIETKTIEKKDLNKIHQQVINEAYEIIRLKRATYYGIGVCLAMITIAIIYDLNCIYPVGIKLDKSFKNSGIYLGYPAKISSSGWNKIDNLKLNEREEKMFDDSSANISKIVEQTVKNTKITRK